MPIMITVFFCLAVPKETVRDMISAFQQTIDHHQFLPQDPEHFVLKRSPNVKNTLCCRTSRFELTAVSSLIAVLLCREMMSILFLFTRPAFAR